ncbi:helix-turn-helix transcriptional regulator [Mucilaginibacter sp.]|jgi:transcriptional regulator with XRE-family HTH domain|uniref:helix-turn-helix domain-containing protein n=1 Tax=Mucilaginibacter sp. TaxID=1882438 RepID=UPI002CB0573D|nr:helix-turn-helix transcriptional regulator [Mucilaginibacter sp.]HTI57588.1 helix-turn-helix transcriptional regulator [Mucilaginibacter sp.]
MKDKLNLKIKQVAASIRKIREHRNYTQEYLAAKLHISQNAYSKIELGYTKITVERLFQISEILETDPVAIINDEGEILKAV